MDNNKKYRSYKTDWENAKRDRVRLISLAKELKALWVKVGPMVSKLIAEENK